MRTLCICVRKHVLLPNTNLRMWTPNVLKQIRVVQRIPSPHLPTPLHLTAPHPSPTPLHPSGIPLEPHRRQLHLSLAHQFQPRQQVQLEQLMSEINADAPAKWELHLYSRDCIQAQSEVCGSGNDMGVIGAWIGRGRGVRRCFFMGCQVGIGFEMSW